MKHKKIILITGLTALIIIICIFVIRKMNNDSEGITLEETADAIIEVMPSNDLYVSTAIIEDFTTAHQTEYHLGLIPEEHSCVQVLRQKVSHKIRMADIKYTMIEPKKVLVKLPEPLYNASTIHSSFVSDDEDYWFQNLSSTKNMKKKIEAQIKNRFDTKENRRKSKFYAMQSISHIITQLGYQVEFEDVVLSSPQTDSF